MEKKLSVNVINHKDVHGRDMWYLKIEHEFVNIGEKTYNKVKALLDAAPLVQENPIPNDVTKKPK